MSAPPRLFEEKARVLVGEGAASIRAGRFWACWDGARAKLCRPVGLAQLSGVERAAGLARAALNCAHFFHIIKHSYNQEKACARFLVLIRFEGFKKISLIYTLNTNKVFGDF